MKAADVAAAQGLTDGQQIQMAPLVSESLLPVRKIENKRCGTHPSRLPRHDVARSSGSTSDRQACPYFRTGSPSRGNRPFLHRSVVCPAASKPSQARPALLGAWRQLRSC